MLLLTIIFFICREALAAVSVFENKQKNSTAWSPDLIIGEKLRIPISGYKMVASYYEHNYIYILQKWILLLFLHNGLC